MRRERWMAIAIALAIVAMRSAIFLLRPETYFDSDQAIVGLMAKHLAEGRALPVFLYGQTYMLGVEAWLAAPLFAIAVVTNERMIFAATSPQRILIYNRIVGDHAGEAVHLSRQACDGGLIPGVYQCR